MSASGAKVRSEAIADFETALGRFAQASLDRVKAAETAIRRTAQQLEDRRSALRRQLARLREEIDSADDEEEDMSRARRQYEETEEALSNVIRWQRTVEASTASYLRESAKLEELSTETTSAARAYLRRVLSDLASYFALQPDIVAASSTFRGDSISAALPTVFASQEPFDPTSFSLPSGYFWVEIREIDTDRELAEIRGEEDFKKVSYAEMQRGFEALRTEILPAINDATNPASKDTFRIRDSGTGVLYENGLLRVYEAFFGNDDPIYLQRGRRDELFSVSNGRHRIKAAMDAGWTAVPVKISDLRR